MTRRATRSRSGRSRARPAWRAVSIGVPLAFLLMFFVYPVVMIMGRSLAPHGHLDLGAIGDVLGDGYYRHVAWFTLWQAVLSTLLTLLIGLPVAYVLARYDFPGKHALRAALIVPFVLPTLVVGSAFLAVLGPTGPLRSLGIAQGLAPILLAHVFFNVAVVVRTVGGMWSHLDPRMEEAARVLGASRTRAFREVTWPILRPAIASAASIVFLFTFTSFGVILVLGGARHATLEVEIYRQATELFDLRVAAVLSLLQLTAVIAAIGWFGRRERRTPALRLRAADETARRPANRAQWFEVLAVLTPVVVFLATPVVVLVARSFATSGGPSLGFYRALGSTHRASSAFPPPIDAVRNSLVIALGTTLIAVVVGGLAALAITGSRRGTPERLLDHSLMLPLGVSAVTIGFGFLVALDRGVLDLRTSPLILPIAHALIAIPFVVRVAVPMLRSIDPKLRDAAAVLGAPPARVWREIDLPIVARAFLVAAGFAFAISLGEFGATAFLARPDFPTLPIEIQRLLGLPGASNFGQAMAASTILMIITGVAVFTIDRFRVGTSASF